LIYHGDCLDVLKTIESASVDMVLADLPYGTTACKWDSVIPFEPLWTELHRVCRPNAAMCMFGSEPFSSALRSSNIKNYRYDWIWEKSNATGFLDARRKPLKAHEIVSVFSIKRSQYFPQKTEGKPYTAKMGTRGESTTADKKIQSGGHITVSDGKRFPRSVIKFSNAEKGLHPTQKPVALLEYLIKTYTSEADTVLDPTMGSGSTGVACANVARRFIGIERDADYFAIAEKRIAEA
jgi:DNA modification methylase